MSPDACEGGSEPHSHPPFLHENNEDHEIRESNENCGQLYFEQHPTLWAIFSGYHENPKFSGASDFFGCSVFLDMLITPNCQVRQNFSNVLFFTDIVIFQNFQEIPTFFSGFHVFPGVLGPPEFLKCPVLPGFHLAYYLDVPFLLDFSCVPFSPDVIFPDRNGYSAI